MSWEKLYPILLEMVSDPNTNITNSFMGLNLLFVAYLGRKTWTQHHKIKDIESKLKKYQGTFRKFELRMERSIHKEKMSKKFSNYLEEFLDDTRLIFEELK